MIAAMNNPVLVTAESSEVLPPGGLLPNAERPPCPLSHCLLMTAVMWISGSPLIGVNTFSKVVIGGLAIALLVSTALKRSSLSAREFWLSCGFLVIAVAQVLSTDFLGAMAELGFFAKLVIAMLTVRFVRNYARVYVEVMFWTALVSFPFFLAMIATGGKIAGMIAPYALKVADIHAASHVYTGIYQNYYLWIHFFAGNHKTQNNAYFWEPGVFAGYLVIAVVCLAAAREQYSSNRYKVTLLVLLLALASTQTTGGYLMAPLALLYHAKTAIRSPLFRVVLVLIALVGMFVLFQEADFLQEKITGQIRVVKTREQGWQLTRLGSMISDWERIQTQPLFGFGPDNTAQHHLIERETMGRQGNGLSAFVAQFGFCGLILFLVGSWIGFRNLFHGEARYAALALVVVLLLLNEETFLNMPFFMTFMFLRKPVLNSSSAYP